MFFFSIFITHNVKYFMFFAFNFDDYGLQHVKGDFRALDAAHKLHANADFLLQQDFAPVHRARTSNWFAESINDWPAISLNRGFIVTRKRGDTRLNNTDELKVTIKAKWASITPQQCYRLTASVPSRTDSVICAKKPSIEYWVHAWTYFFDDRHFCIVTPF